MKAASHLNALLFDYARRCDDLRLPRIVGEPTPACDEPINAALGVRPVAQNLVSAGSGAQLAFHADELVRTFVRLGMPDCGDDARPQVAQIARILSDFFGAADDCPALLFYHAWCVTHASRYRQRGAQVRNVPGTVAVHPASRDRAQLAFDPAGRRTVSVATRRLRWAVGSRGPDPALLPMRVAADRQSHRGARRVAATHHESLGLVAMSRPLVRALLDGFYPAHDGRVIEWPANAWHVCDFVILRAARLRPARVEEGVVVESVEDQLSLALDRHDASVGYITAINDQFLNDTRDQEAPNRDLVWDLLEPRRSTTTA